MYDFNTSLGHKKNIKYTLWSCRKKKIKYVRLQYEFSQHFEPTEMFFIIFS